MATTGIHSAWSDACSEGGNGQCDGIVPDDEMDMLPADCNYGITDECACPCHTAYGWEGDAFNVGSVAEMHAAHVAYHKQYSRLENNNG